MVCGNSIITHFGAVVFFFVHFFDLLIYSYYHLRKVREQCVESVPEIVPLTMPQQTGDIHIEKNGLQISLPADISKETLIALVQELC